jgi:hypothetical protein
MSVLVSRRDEAMRYVGVCEFLGEFIEKFRGRVDRVGLVDGNEGGIVAHYLSVMVNGGELTVVTQLE